MKRLLAWLFGLPSLIILLLFALANRHMVTLSLDPLTPEDPVIALTMPLWAVLFLGILLGLLAGGVATWFRQSKWRKQARTCRRDLEMERLARKRLEERAAQAAPVAAPAAPSAAPSGQPAVAAAPNAPNRPALPAR